MSLKNIIAQLKQVVEARALELLESEFQLTDIDTTQFKFETPPEEKMGNLAFACFPLAKVARKAPVMIAKTLAENWGDSQYFQRVEAAGPYLNFFFDSRFLAAELIPTCVTDERYGDNDMGKDATSVLEYSSPNTNKPLHLGHGRNNLLGMVIARLLDHSGYNVVKANLVNDRGIHICKSMLAYKKWGNGETPESAGVKGDKLIGNYYVLYSQKEKEQPELLEEAQQMLRDWEAGDPEVRKLWRQLNDWVLEGFRETYDRMGASFDKYYYESETYKGGREIILDAFEKGICYEEENGAIAINLEAEKLTNKILLRGDGTSMYITQDINTTVTKFKDHDDKLDNCLFVVGNEQDNHFRVLFTVLKKFGFEWADRCEHISYGMITLPEGKMKSREGTVVDLDDLMNELKAMSLDELKERSKNDPDQDEEALENTAEAIGQAAIKFYILKTNAVREILFNPKESLSFDGMTGPYLQYTHARMASILRKAEDENDSVSLGNYEWNQEENSLLVQLGRYPDALKQSAIDRNPATLCGYVYDLCRLYNKFYYEHSVLKVDDPETKLARLGLTKAVKKVVKKTLTILGITALEKM